MKPGSVKYRMEQASMENYPWKLSFNPPKSRAGKILKFKHYHTDAPI